MYSSNTSKQNRLLELLGRTGDYLRAPALPWANEFRLRGSWYSSGVALLFLSREGVEPSHQPSAYPLVVARGVTPDSLRTNGGHRFNETREFGGIS